MMDSRALELRFDSELDRWAIRLQSEAPAQAVFQCPQCLDFGQGIRSYLFADADLPGNSIGLAVGARCEQHVPTTILQIEHRQKMIVRSEPMLDRVISITMDDDLFKPRYVGDGAWDLGASIWLDLAMDGINVLQEKPGSTSTTIRSCSLSMGSNALSLFHISKRANAIRSTQVAFSKADGPHWLIVGCVLVHVRMWVTASDF